MLLAGLAAATPAGAIDSLSGVWTGKFSCGSTTATTTSKQKVDATLFVEDLGDGTGNVRVTNASLLPFPVKIVSGADRPTEGRLAGVVCDFDPVAGGLVVQGLAKVKSGSEKGAMTGQLIDYSVGAGGVSVSVCSFKLKRTGPLESPVGACPP
jgi:hypothetical protein